MELMFSTSSQTWHSRSSEISCWSQTSFSMNGMKATTGAKPTNILLLKWWRTLRMETLLLWTVFWQTTLVSLCVFAFLQTVMVCVVDLYQSLELSFFLKKRAGWLNLLAYRISYCLVNSFLLRPRLLPGRQDPVLGLVLEPKQHAVEHIQSKCERDRQWDWVGWG